MKIPIYQSEYETFTALTAQHKLLYTVLYCKLYIFLFWNVPIRYFAFSLHQRLQINSKLVKMKVSNS